MKYLEIPLLAEVNELISTITSPDPDTTLIAKVEGFIDFLILLFL